MASLSERETDVLRLMAEGRSNNGIAGQLFVTPKAVEKHIANIFGKLGLHTDTSEHHPPGPCRAHLPALPADRGVTRRSSPGPDIGLGGAGPGS